ncbi:hypothetical protein [Vibrio nitrifigilis]|uniref:Uncharacterized protein n=1 Tax=Vibrio nitrifigilis TaxID=2789781 RepID=A0ABS0GMR4_9VIBR|nr:hypothetical protein [Vibrio nitrifigilis]MBF9003640.1 hypothetical protein [Vibrio nitrifigilis]MBF9003642.1 hypothetical protein [Vibrio nitrifigilis]
MSTANIISQLKAGSPLITLLKMVKGVFDDRSSADELYSDLIPVLQDFLLQGRRFNDPSVQHIVHILSELPPEGARRRNFVKKYLQDEYTLRDLPADPRQIPYGFWY